jgi:hypothetical protein
MTTSPPPPPPPWAWWYESARRPTSGAAADVRVSDAERNAMADLLAKHYGDGRLDDEEFKARIDRAMSAKTRSDFYGLTEDLPPLESQGPAVPARRRRHHLSPVLGVVLVIALFSWSMSSIFWAPHVPWLLFVIVGLLLWRRHSWRSWHRYHDHSHPAPPPFG